MASLFEDFEVNHTPFWPRIGRLIGISLGVHTVAMAAILYVPAFRDALNIAFLFSGAEFVSRDYTRTTIGDDVRMVELAGGKFRYPDGYFAPEGAQLAAVQNDPNVPQIISQAGPGPGVKPASTPTPTPEPTPTPTPLQSPTSAIADSTPTAGAGTSPASDKKAEAAKDEKDLTREEAQKQLDKLAAENNMELPKEGDINKKALKDFAAEANKLKNEGKLDLDQPFEIIIEGELGKDGKLINAKFTRKTGDENLTYLGGRMVATLNDSGVLFYLKHISADNPGIRVVFTIKLDQSEVVATVESETSSIERAEKYALFFKALLISGAETRAGKDEEVLLKNTTVSSDQKRIRFNFTMPRETAVEMIKKQLDSLKQTDGTGAV